MTTAVQAELVKLQQQIDDGAARVPGASGGAGGEHKFNKGFIPVKELKPVKLAKEEQWRDWAELFT